MSVYHKFWWCPGCQGRVVVSVTGEISDYQPYGEGAVPEPDVVWADSARCEHGHEFTRLQAQEVLESIAGLEVF